MVPRASFPGRGLPCCGPQGKINCTISHDTLATWPLRTRHSTHQLLQEIQKHLQCCDGSRVIHAFLWTRKGRECHAAHGRPSIAPGLTFTPVEWARVLCPAPFSNSHQKCIVTALTLLSV